VMKDRISAKLVQQFVSAQTELAATIGFVPVGGRW